MAPNPSRIDRVTITVCIVLLGTLAPATPAHSQCPRHELSKYSAPDAATNDVFGRSVGISGDIAVVGSPGDDDACPGTEPCESGSAYVYVRTNGGWALEAKLTASDAAQGDYFGWSVSVSGTTLVVGAYGDKHGSATESGSAYVFERDRGAWMQQAKLIASDYAQADRFGYSVANYGGTVVIGALTDSLSPALPRTGSAYVFERTAGVWTQQAKLTASDAATDDRFGRTVAISGHTVLVGAFHDDNTGGRGAGAAYVFVRSGSNWFQQAKLTASDAGPVKWFGWAVALFGDTAIVSSVQDSNVGGASAGSAYIFVRSLGIWSQQAKLIASDAAPYNFLGESVSIDGDLAAVVAEGWTGANYVGSGYLFVRNGSHWSEKAKLAASDVVPVEAFGISVGVSNGTAVIGAHHGNVAGASDAGAAYFFDTGSDLDCDGIVDWADNCPRQFNPGQEDTDHNGKGDACDPGIDPAALSEND